MYRVTYNPCWVTLLSFVSEQLEKQINLVEYCLCEGVHRGHKQNFSMNAKELVTSMKRIRKDSIGYCIKYFLPHYQWWFLRVFFFSKFSFVHCFGLQWLHFLIMIQLHACEHCGAHIYFKMFQAHAPSVSVFPFIN